MELRVIRGAIQDTDADTLIVNLFAGVERPGGATGALDQALGGAVAELVEGGDFRGKAGEVAVLYPRGALRARRVLVVGLGPREAFDAEAVRRAAAAAIRRARTLGADHVATIVHGAGQGGLDPATAAQATVEGSLLALYRYRAPRREPDEPHDLRTLTVVEFDQARIADIDRGLRAAEAVAAGVTLARDLVNLPPNVATPTLLAEAARDLARTHGLQITVGDRAWAAERNMGAFLAVAQGAQEPPAFIVLEHDPHPGSEEHPPIVLVGKGITFDSGGLSLKTRTAMVSMKSDMGGAAAVLGAMKAITALNLPLPVVAIAPCTENMPDGGAYRPADVITASDGTTIEILSTDAEGRMVLADALVYARSYRPRAVIDLATLTGAAVTALGKGVAAALFSNDAGLTERLQAAARASHERIWPLPLWDDYREKIRSKVADLKNSGGPSGGVGTSASFLQAFTDYPWAHLDIAGMVLEDKAGPYAPAGATGFGVRLLVELLRGWSDAA